MKEVRIINLTVQFAKGQLDTEEKVGEMISRLVGLVYDNTNAEVCLSDIPDCSPMDLYVERCNKDGVPRRER